MTILSCIFIAGLLSKESVLILFLPVGCIFYYFFSEDEKKGEEDVEGRRFGKGVEVYKSKKMD